MLVLVICSVLKKLKKRNHSYVIYLGKKYEAISGDWTYKQQAPVLQVYDLSF
jgi:hypothetical protein